MAEPAGPFHALWHGGYQYLCYCAAPESSGFDVYVTNASEVWSTDFTLEKLEGHKSQSGMCPSEDYSTKFREAFEHRAAALTVHDSKATLQLKEAAEDAAAAAASCSPEKNLLQSQRLLIPDLSPRKNRGGGSAVTAKKRVPGESLINPGFKSGARCPVRCIDWTPKGWLPRTGGGGTSTCTSSCSAMATSFLPASWAGRQQTPHPAAAPIPAPEQREPSWWRRKVEKIELRGRGRVNGGAGPQGKRRGKEWGLREETG